MSTLSDPVVDCARSLAVPTLVPDAIDTYGPAPLAPAFTSFRMRSSGRLAGEAETSPGLVRRFILLRMEGRTADAGTRGVGKEADEGTEGGTEGGTVLAGDTDMRWYTSDGLLDKARLRWRNAYEYESTLDKERPRTLSLLI
jgi:hypothetical protein